eukprot:TRINITY_DN13440_c0_g1_i2.p1 TRINITY_DN13440_c0_g1~~TRINITY_DN13440_c0_g1_i2.p1  ORF type:complete len:322 (+),score=19.25 TRINITY_DN13440_c0_g1_i2:111-1076(+)
MHFKSQAMANLERLRRVFGGVIRSTTMRMFSACADEFVPQCTSLGFAGWPVYLSHCFSLKCSSLLLVLQLCGSVRYCRPSNQEGKLRITLAASLLFPAPVFGVWAVLNSIAWAHGSTMALPFGTVCAILWLFFGATIPFTAVGVSIGGQFAVPWESIVPCRTKTQSRTVPQGPWYTSIPAHLFVAGFLPFSAIFVELYYAFISLWGHQLYTPYGILYLCFGVLLVVDASITVSLTYLQLSMEDHRWWPVSLFSGGSTAAFVFVYSFYFLVRESHMSGFLQVSYFVGYSLVLCYGLFLMLAAVGWYCSYIFVKQIYASIKCD